VAGFDICESSIVNAKANAAANGLECCEYYCGKAEDTLPKFLATLPAASSIIEASTPVAPAADAAATAASTVAATVPTPLAPSSTAASSPIATIPALVAVVDPPRSGLHPNVLKALRRCTRLDALVYVSCNPVTLFADLHKLTQSASSKSQGAAFELEKVVAVDMFAHTEHVEVVVALRRRK
jgi:tRNA (uracil-5-)-methyltransferase